jgi:putative spermidine/putrescine transport system permease protein
MSKHASKFIWYFSLVAIYTFLLAPLIICIVVSFNGEANMAFPPESFSLRWYRNFFSRSQFQDALKFSSLLAGSVALSSATIGTMLAIALNNSRFKAGKFLGLFLILPIFIPEVVTGLAMLLITSKAGLGLGFKSLLIVHTIVTLPYATCTTLVCLKAFDKTLVDASRNLGASYWQTLAKVVIPIVKPGICSGFIFAFLLSFDNLIISSFLLSPLQTTLPLEVSMYIRTKPDPTVAAIATLLMVSTAVCVVIVNKLFGLEKLVKIRQNH